MRTKVTLFLVFLNVALFFYIFKFERNWQTERELVEKGSLVLGATAANLQSIQMSGPALPAPIDLVRRGNEGWFVTFAKSFEWPANPFAVNSILTGLEQLEHETSFSAEESDLAKNRVTLATYGLAEPRLTVTFSANESGAGALTMQVGAATPDGKRLYVLSPDRKWIHVVGNRLAERLIKPADQLRHDALFTIGATEVKSINVRTAATQPSRIERDAANRWLFLSPIRARANDQATLRAVTGLTNLRVKSFPQNPPPADALTDTLRINLVGNGRSETLHLGARVPRPAAAPEPAGEAEYYATLETTRNNQPVTSAPFTVVLPAALENLLQKSTLELRERRLFPDLDARTVTAVNLSGVGSGALTLQRLDAGPGAAPSWHVVRATTAAANTPSADTAVIDRLIARLAELEAVSFVTEAPNGADLENWGFNQPERVITLTLGTGQPPPKLELGYDRDRRVVRARFAGGDSTTIFEVRPEIITDASLQPLDYRNRLIRDLPAGVARITRLKLTDEIAKTTLLEQNLADPAAPVPPAVTELLRPLQSLRAERFVAETFGPVVLIDNTERPWRYRLEMDIALVAGVGSTQTTTTTLMLSERSGGTLQFAGAEEFRAVWRLEQALIDPLWKIISAPTDPGAPGRVP